MHSCTTVTGSIQGYRFAANLCSTLLPHFAVKLPNQDPLNLPLASHTNPPSSTELPVIGLLTPQPPLCHHPILNNLTLHPALFGTWTPRQAGRLLSFSSLCPILDILDTASIPAVLTRPTGRHDSEARLRASGGDVTPAHHQGGTHYQLRIPKRL